MTTCAKAINRPRRWVAVFGCAAVAAVACGRAPSPAEVPPNIPTSCSSALQLPSDVLTVPEPLPPLVNRSNVSPQDASAWERGMMRALRVEAWALGQRS
jgi:hypothetical protein